MEANTPALWALVGREEMLKTSKEVTFVLECVDPRVPREVAGERGPIELPV